MRRAAGCSKRLANGFRQDAMPRNDSSASQKDFSPVGATHFAGRTPLLKAITSTVWAPCMEEETKI